MYMYTVEDCYKNTVGTRIQYSYSVLVLTGSVIYYPGTVPRTGSSYYYGLFMLTSGILIASLSQFH